MHGDFDSPVSFHQNGADHPDGWEEYVMRPARISFIGGGGAGTQEGRGPPMMKESVPRAVEKREEWNRRIMIILREIGFPATSRTGKWEPGCT